MPAADLMPAADQPRIPKQSAMWLRPLSMDDILFVMKHMRPADREEIYATSRAEDHDFFAHYLMGTRQEFGCIAGKGARPIAVLGNVEMWPRVWTSYMFATDDIGQIGLSLTRHVKRVMIPAVWAAGAHRGQAFSLASHTEAHRWLDGLGAKPEATLKGYGKDGQDFIVYAWR